MTTQLFILPLPFIISNDKLHYIYDYTVFYEALQRDIITLSLVASCEYVETYSKIVSHIIFKSETYSKKYNRIIEYLLHDVIHIPIHFLLHHKIHNVFLSCFSF